MALCRRVRVAIYSHTRQVADVHLGIARCHVTFTVAKICQQLQHGRLTDARRLGPSTRVVETGLYILSFHDWSLNVPICTILLMISVERTTILGLHLLLPYTTRLDHFIFLFKNH